MGYTHTFEMTKKPDQGQWASLMLDVQTLFNTLPDVQMLSHLGFDAEDDIVLRGPLGDNKPICHSRKISFNGDASKGMAHETFTLLAKKMDDFCKTDRKPYDFAVCAVLILAFTHLPDCVRILSDGDEEDWTPALSWVRSHIRSNALMPAGITAAPNRPVMEFPANALAGQTVAMYLRGLGTTIGDFYFS